MAFVQNAFSDFRTDSHGFLYINPSDLRTAINLVDDEPTQALDINGNARIRALSAGTNVGIVTHESNGTLHTLAFDLANPNNVLHADGSWGPVAGSGGNDFDWEISSDGSDVYTGHPNLLGYPTKRVGIGASSGFVAKFNVFSDSDDKFATYIEKDCSNNSEGSFLTSIYGKITNIPYNYYGTTVGVYGVANGNENKNNIGVYGLASQGRDNVGVYGQAYEPSGIGVVGSIIGDGLAGAFFGNVGISGNLVVNGTYPGSDLMLKENIQNLNNGLNIISQLSPKTFNFKTTEFPQMGLSEGLQYGMIAQEVEQILPDLVINAHQPSDKDSLGNILHESFTYKALNYTAIIPILIQAVKEQQDSIITLKNVIASYEARFNNIEAMLASCCSNNGNTAKTTSTDINSVVNITPDNTFGKNETELYQNIPNPFTTKTTFNYTIGNKGNVELEIMTYSGQFVAKLVNTYQEEGNYSIDWNTSDIAPGIYFYTLRVNNVEWVKKAIRIK